LTKRCYSIAEAAGIEVNQICCQRLIYVDFRLVGE